MKYCRPTKTADRSENIVTIARHLKAELSDSDSAEKAVAVVRKWLNDNAYDKSYSPPKPYKIAKSLIESRTIKASELIKKTMASCGALVSLGTALLREMGYKVKMVHGRHPKSDHHAWISIYDESTRSWQEYDFTGYGNGPAGDITDLHVKEIECEDWVDIMPLLLDQHKAHESRRKH